MGHCWALRSVRVLSSVYLQGRHVVLRIRKASGSAVRRRSACIYAWNVFRPKVTGYAVTAPPRALSLRLLFPPLSLSLSFSLSVSPTRNYTHTIVYIYFLNISTTRERERFGESSCANAYIPHYYTVRCTGKSNPPNPPTPHTRRSLATANPSTRIESPPTGAGTLQQRAEKRESGE